MARHSHNRKTICTFKPRWSHKKIGLTKHNIRYIWKIELIELNNCINSDQQESARAEKKFFEFRRKLLRNTEFCLLSIAQKSVSY